MQLYYKQIALGNKTLGGNCNSSCIMAYSLFQRGESWSADFCSRKAVYTELEIQGEAKNGFVKSQVSACPFSWAFKFSPQLKGRLGSHAFFLVSHRDCTLLMPRNIVWLDLLFVACRR